MADDLEAGYRFIVREMERAAGNGDRLAELAATQRMLAFAHADIMQRVPIRPLYG